MISDKTLMVYADGELDSDERARVEAALLDDGRVQSVLAEEWLLRRSVLNLYDPVLTEELPPRLRRLLEAASEPQPASMDYAPGRHGWWRNVTAIAATLIVGMFVGHSLATDPPSPAGASQWADKEIATALDTQLASTQSPDAPIQVGISFTSLEGVPCRNFQSRDTVGLACRQEGRWAVRLLAPFERSSASDYQQAGSATALIMKSAQELMAGEPMDAVEERRARDRGWLPEAR